VAATHDVALDVWASLLLAIPRLFAGCSWMIVSWLSFGSKSLDQAKWYEYDSHFYDLLHVS
jgi:hypothetical protein